MGKRLVFRDMNYPTAFLDRNLSGQLVQELSRRDFREVNAVQLRNEMLATVSGDEPDTLAVFAQDIAPDTVVDDVSASALVRRYLDCGGSILWLGDIPFFYRGRTGGRRDDVWKYGTPAAILGIIPFVSCLPREQVSLTKAGKESGLATTWTGIRPIATGRGIVPFAESTYLIANPFLPYPQPTPWWRRMFGSIRIGPGPVPSLELGVGPGSTPTEKTTSGGTWYEVTLINAWHKKFRRGKPRAGFYRLWDTNNLNRVVSFTELYDLIKRIAGRTT